MIMRYKRKLPSKNKCNGCSACYNSCPFDAISLDVDGEGFCIPTVSSDKCKDCGLCERVCPVLHDNSTSITNYYGAYACKNTIENERNASSSGGIFVLLAKKILMEGGIVFGAVIDDSKNIVHSKAENEAELLKMLGSKYVQSYIGDIYRKVKEELDSGRKCLFVGTPCQVNGLAYYLQKKYNNLLLCDFICHGVPSPLVWKQYVKYLEKKYDSFIKEVYFRNKKNGWKKYRLLIKFENGVVLEECHADNIFMNLFLKDTCLRRSCYSCKAKGANRLSDITLADFWGIEHVEPSFDDDKGVSFVIVNSSKGNDYFNYIGHDMDWKEINMSNAVSSNGSYANSCIYNIYRKKVMRKIISENFDYSNNMAVKTNPYVINLIFIIRRKVKRLFGKKS